MKQRPVTWLNTMLFSVLTASVRLLAEEAVNEIPEEVAAEFQSRWHGETEVVVVDTLRGDNGRVGGNDRQLSVFSDFIESMETKHRDRWLTLCFLPAAVATLDRLAESEQRRRCAKFPVSLGEEWAPSRTMNTLLNETMKRLRRTEVHLLNLVGAFCGFSVILELLLAGIAPRTIVFAPGRGFPYCADEILEAVPGRISCFETLLLTLGYEPDPLNEHLEDAGVPLMIMTAAEQSQFLSASGKISLRHDIPCQSLSAREELRESAAFDFSYPCVGIEGGQLSSTVRVYVDEDTSVAVDRHWATRPRVCRHGALPVDSEAVDKYKGAMVNQLNAYSWERHTKYLERLRRNSEHRCRWYAPCVPSEHNI